MPRRWGQAQTAGWTIDNAINSNTSVTQAEEEKGEVGRKLKIQEFYVQEKRGGALSRIKVSSGGKI